MVYVTSQAVHPIILEYYLLEYYLQFLAGIPASHARSRLTLLCADDASPRSLTEKILERPRLIERIRAGIVDPALLRPGGALRRADAAQRPEPSTERHEQALAAPRAPEPREAAA